ncbi:MAG: hypothetical protein AAFN10_23980 [Bacteroidota bacterium]
MLNNQTIQAAPIDPGDWQELLGSIALESCVLFVGPGAIVDDVGVPLRERLLSILKGQLPQGTFEDSHSCWWRIIVADKQARLVNSGFRQTLNRFILSR